MKTVGVPLDVDLLNRLETNWKAIQLDLIHTTDFGLWRLRRDGQL